MTASQYLCSPEQRPRQAEQLHRKERPRGSKAPRAALCRRRGSAAYQKESDLLLPCREARMNVCKRGVEPAVECSDHIAELRLLERL